MKWIIIFGVLKSESYKTNLLSQCHESILEQNQTTCDNLKRTHSNYKVSRFCPITKFKILLLTIIVEMRDQIFYLKNKRSCQLLLT